MARHPQTRELAKFKGADRKNPQRYKKDVPVNPEPIGVPAHLSEKARAVFAELKSMALPGVLTASDGPIFEITANLLAEYRADPEAFPVGKYTHLIGCLARLGMSPADRQKLGTEKPKKDNDFDDF
ncbi:hypothetical protein GCM10027347_58860 [Larkinella harenae]